MKVKIATAQYPITEHLTFKDWQNHIEKWIRNAIEKGAELLLFPEYGSMELVSLLDSEVKQDIRLQVYAMNILLPDFCKTFSEFAQKYNVIIAAPSFPFVEGDKIFNRVFVFSSKGQVGYQDKFFMTRFENEEWGISSAPKQLTVFQSSWGSFGIQICYDVEFPIGSQVLSAKGVEMILAPSCTETIRGATRVHVGARARALENQCYVVVSQTINNAEWSPTVDINYGYSAIYCPPDKNLPENGIVSSQNPQTEGWLIETLDLNLLQNVRNDGQVFNFRDVQHIEMKLKEEIEVTFVKI